MIEQPGVEELLRISVEVEIRSLHELVRFPTARAEIYLGEALDHFENGIRGVAVRELVNDVCVRIVGVDEHLKTLQHSVIGYVALGLSEIAVKLRWRDAAEDSFAELRGVDRAAPDSVGNEGYMAVPALEVEGPVFQAFLLVEGD